MVLKIKRPLIELVPKDGYKVYQAGPLLHITADKEGLKKLKEWIK